MALSADTPRVYELGELNDVPVKASTIIYEGAAVGLTSGYARGLVAGDLFVGFAQRQADNSAVATDGNINCKVVVRGLAQLTITDVAVTDVGNPVYASADGTFTLTKSTNSYIGNVYRYVSANLAIVAFIAQGAVTGNVAGGTLASGDLLVGNGSNVAAAVTPGGILSMTNAGVFSLTSAALSTQLSYAKSYITSHLLSSAH